MRVTITAGLLMLSITTGALAGRQCKVDVEPLLGVHFLRSVENDATTAATFSSGELLLSKGGAVTMMRTDSACCGGRPTRTFVSGQLDQDQLQRIQRALDHALTSGPLADCLIDSFSQPGNGHSTFGGSELTVYRGGNGPLRFNIEHADPDTPAPECASEVRLLESVLVAAEDTLRAGVSPLQCVPYSPRPN